MHIMHFIQGESSLDRVLCCFHTLHKICHSGDLGWASNMMSSEYLPFCPKVWDTNISINQQIQNKTKTGGFWKLLLLASLLPPHCHCNAANPQRCSKSQMPKLKIDRFFSSWTFLRAEAWDRRSPLTLPSILLSPSLSHRHHLSPPRNNNLSCQSKHSSSRHTLFFSVILADCTC